MGRSTPRSTRLWSSVRDLWDELVTGPLCPVPHVVQSIHLGVEDKRGQSTCIFQLGHSLAHLTYGVIWFACSPAHLLGWGMFTEAVSRKAGKPDISNSILNVNITVCMLKEQNTEPGESIAFIVGGKQACYLSQSGTSLQPSKLLFANTILRSGLSKEWSGSCIFGKPSKTCRSVRDLWRRSSPNRKYIHR